jgi:hypothetical protein
VSAGARLDRPATNLEQLTGCECELVGAEVGGWVPVVDFASSCGCAGDPVNNLTLDGRKTATVKLTLLTRANMTVALRGWSSVKFSGRLGR